MPPPPIPAAALEGTNGHGKYGNGLGHDGGVIHPDALEVEFETMWENEPELDDEDLTMMEM